MNAKEARKISDDIKNGKNLKQIREIMRLIEQTAERGETECLYRNKMDTDIIKYLHEEGYGLYSNVSDCTMITWKR